MKTQITLILIILLGFSICFAQKPNTAKTDTRGSISGQVLDENGSPIEDAGVGVNPLGSRERGDFVSTTTDRKGRFEFENLKPRKYRIYVSHTGYVLPELEINPPEDRPTYKIGENITFNMQKGGVITGKVFDEEGEPLIKIRVNVVRIRNQFGQKILAERVDRYSQQNFTDDRGIYRIFGLNAGSYLIFVGGRSQYEQPSIRLAESSPVYHPSDPIDTAAEVFVNFGQETGFVDVRLREMRGFTVSGKIYGADPGAGNEGRSFIMLTHSKTKQEIAFTNVTQQNGEYSFKFEQIPNGEYEISALQWGERSIISKSPVKSITIKNSDITGVNINLKPLSALTGEMILEKNPDLKKIEECRPPSVNALTESVFRLIPEEKSNEAINWFIPSLLTFADENGKFEIFGIEIGKYHLEAKFADESLFIDSIFKQVSPKEKLDVGRNGFNFGNGENVENVLIKLRDGAAKISGQIEIEKSDKIIESPINFAVYLIPSETESKDNILRYRKLAAENDGSFVFTNIVPGKYYILVKPFILELDQIQDKALPEFWRSQDRLALFEEAKNVGTEITLDICRKMSDKKVVFKQ